MEPGVKQVTKVIGTYGSYSIHTASDGTYAVIRNGVEVARFGAIVAAYTFATNRAGGMATGD